MGIIERINGLIPDWFKMVVGHALSGFVIAFGYSFFSTLGQGLSIDLAIQAGILAGVYAVYKILTEKWGQSTGAGKKVKKYIL